MLQEHAIYAPICSKKTQNISHLDNGCSHTWAIPQRVSIQRLGESTSSRELQYATYLHNGCPHTGTGSREVSIQRFGSSTTTPFIRSYNISTHTYLHIQLHTYTHKTHINTPTNTNTQINTYTNTNTHIHPKTGIPAKRWSTNTVTSTNPQLVITSPYRGGLLWGGI